MIYTENQTYTKLLSEVAKENEVDEILLVTPQGTVNDSLASIILAYTFDKDSYPGLTSTYLYHELIAAGCDSVISLMVTLDLTMTDYAQHNYCVPSVH